MPTRPKTHYCGIVNTAGDTIIIPSPGKDYRIRVFAFVIQNESASATTILLKDNNNTHWRCLCQFQGCGLTMKFDKESLWALGEDSPLKISLSDDNQCSYSIMFDTEEV